MTRGQILARHLVVRGRVQHVGFRRAAVREAARHGVTGWVKNCPDGAVEAHLEGPAPLVAALELWFASGPVAARVDEVVAVDAEPLELREFALRR